MHDDPGRAKSGENAAAAPSRPRSRRWMLWVAAAVVVVVAVSVVVIGSLTSGTTADVVPGVNQATADLLQLDSTADQHLTASPFTLTDQNGKPMSLSDYRGKAVVLTFNDDQCTDVCTLLAQDVVAANRDLGAAKSKVAFVSINANPYFPATTTVKQWTDQHGLGHTANWYFGTGSPATLAGLAKKYGVPIELDPTNKTVEHGTEIFFIGPGGRVARLGEFGIESADTAQFGHAIAQVADDLLPAAQRSHIAGPAVTAPHTGGTQLGATPAAIHLPVLGTSSTTFSTASDRGKYTVLNFWASTCTACTSETPALEAEHKLLGDTVAFVGVDVADRTTAGGAFAHKFGVTYPLLADKNGTTAGTFAVSGLPYTVILSPQGKVLVRHPGAFTQEQLDYLLHNLTESASQ